MADVRWIKLSVNTFDDEKIKLIKALPEGNTLIVIWCQLLCLAGKVNDNGFVYVGQNMLYTDEMLATIFSETVNNVRLALKTFEQFGMIESTEHGLYLVNWGAYQNIDGMEKLREDNRIRNIRYRERKRLEEECSRDIIVTSHDALEKRREEKIREDIYTTPLPPSENIPYQKIIDDYNSTCSGLPKVRSLTDGRRKAIRARWNEHGEAAFSDLFAAAAASSFLNGKNDRNWLADFDWLMKEANFAKVLEGKYRDKEVRINGNNRAGGGARYVEQHTDDEYAQFYAN
jgi:predicted phage replisome organizer